MRPRITARRGSAGRRAAGLRDGTAPTVLSSSVTGNVLTVTFSENVVSARTPGLSPKDGVLNGVCTLATGNGSRVHTYTISFTPGAGHSLVLNYSEVNGGILDGAGNHLADFSNAPCTNNN